MLFDLRSRGRRRTVRIIYSGLALVMVVGLIGFGVGTGVGGGLFNAASNSGSGGNSGSGQLDAQVKSAVRRTQRQPTSSAAWAALISARWSDAGSGSNYDTSTDSYTASGRKELNLLGQNFQKYSSLTKAPALQVSQLAAESYGYVSQYASESSAWQDVVADEPGQASPLACLTYSAYAAKQTRTATLAQAATLKAAPAADKTKLKQTFGEAAKTPAYAEAFAGGNAAVGSGC